MKSWTSAALAAAISSRLTGS